MKIVITGTSRGIGKHLFEHYRNDGNIVFGINRKEVNLCNWEKTEEYFKDIKFQGINTFIHCAAKNITNFFYKMSYNSFKEMVDNNILGTFNVLKCIIPKLSREGNIILFSSSAAISPRLGQSTYCCCKNAVHGLVKVLYRELLVEKKYIFVIAPGLVETGMASDMLTNVSLYKALKIIPMQKFCTTNDIINSIDFLCKTPYLTGQTIHLNGGLYIV